jgi:hypothetical protein
MSANLKSSGAKAAGHLKTAYSVYFKLYKAKPSSEKTRGRISLDLWPAA